MKFMITLLFLVTVLTGKALADTPALKEDLLKYGAFGNVLVYKAEAQPQHVMIFVSGDGGFDKPFINMVNTAAQPGVMVIAVDINTYLKNMAKQKTACMYTAADLEGLSQFVQGHYGYSQYVTPILTGYSSGATLVYASMVQGPPNTFAGVITLGFCDDMSSPKLFCKGAGLNGKPGGLKEPTDPKNFNSYVYDKVSSTVAPWITIQGDKDQVCPLDKATTFTTGIGNVSVVSLTGVGHGFLNAEKWQDAFTKAFNDILAKQRQAEAAKVKPQPLTDLPIIENGLPSPKGKPLAVIITGDGGWAGIDREIGTALNQDGLNVIGLNSLQYFWKSKTPAQAGKDLSRILSWYEATWNPSSVILIGYSRGAENLPFMVNRLPESQKSNIRTIALLGAERKASFTFHVSDWLLSGSSTDDLPIKPEAIKMPSSARLCIYGADEAADSLCPTLDPKAFTILKTPGGHHFGGDYQKLARAILSNTN